MTKSFFYILSLFSENFNIFSFFEKINKQFKKDQILYLDKLKKLNESEIDFKNKKKLQKIINIFEKDKFFDESEDEVENVFWLKKTFQEFTLKAKSYINKLNITQKKKQKLKLK